MATRRAFFRKGIEAGGYVVAGDFLLSACATTAKERREKEVQGLKEMLRGHNLNSSLSAHIDSFLNSLTTVSQSDYELAIAKEKASGADSPIYAIHYNNYNGSPIETIYLASKRLNDRISLEGIVISTNIMPTDQIKAFPEMMQFLESTFENMQRKSIQNKEIKLGKSVDELSIDISTSDYGIGGAGAYKVRARVVSGRETFSHSYIKVRPQAAKF